MEIPSTTIALLAETGADGVVERLVGVEPVARVGWEPWLSFARRSDEPTVQMVARGLHLAAISMPGWRAGSVTPVKGLLWELEERCGPIAIVEFVRWASRYPPFYFGEFGYAHDIPDWDALSPEQRTEAAKLARPTWYASDAEARQRAMDLHTQRAREGRLTRFAWNGTPVSRTRAAETQRLQQRTSRQEKAAEVAKLALLPPVERLRVISARTDRTVGYWPGRFAEVEDAVLEALGRGVATRLFLACRQAHSGKWNTLQERLSKLQLVDWTHVREVVLRETE